LLLGTGLGGHVLDADLDVDIVGVRGRPQGADEREAGNDDRQGVPDANSQQTLSPPPVTSEYRI
jgi:hypothetical protein